MSFLDDLAAAKEKVSDRVKTPEIECLINGSVHSVVFYRANQTDWSLATAQHPPRSGVTIDLRNGYNISEVARALSPRYGRVVDGESELELTAEQWADTWSVLPPVTARLIEANVWSLHEYDTEQEIARAKKASQRRSRKKSS